jgi:hypothetical protein
MPTELKKMRKFRFQLLHRWLVEHVPPCRVADIGGGKGLLTHLLRESGWAATVIDPLHQPLPPRYKDLAGRRIRLASVEGVPRISRPFEPEMARHFDLLVGLHAHGCNIMIIDAAARFHRGFVLLPCCVLDEPLLPPPGQHWMQFLEEYAIGQGHRVERFQLNCSGQNVGLYAPGALVPYRCASPGV